MPEPCVREAGGTVGLGAAEGSALLGPVLNKRLCTEDSRAPRTGAFRRCLGVPTGPPRLLTHGGALSLLLPLLGADLC